MLIFVIFICVYLCLPHQLAMMPTPITQWRMPDLPEGFEVLIKRDDMTGSSLSGNKVRNIVTLELSSYCHCVHWSLCALVTARTGHCAHWSLSALPTACTAHCVHWSLRALVTACPGHCTHLSMNTLVEASTYHCANWSLQALVTH